MDSITLSPTERIVHELNSLYGRYGYSRFKMNKFEEYDLYAKNKDFLVSDNVITFTDTNGRLMALKPDVTMSIVKNTRDSKEAISKLFYNENVYRVSKGTGSYKELLQAGLEAVGNVDDYCIYEVLKLAAKSLLLIGENAILEITHLDILGDVLAYAGITESSVKKTMDLIGSRNTHELESYLKGTGITSGNILLIKELISLYGTVDEVLPELERIAGNIVNRQRLDKFKEILTLLNTEKHRDMIRIDFHATGHSRYYNGFLFKGFIEGCPDALISGGQYDPLVKRMKRDARAIGFGVYLDVISSILDRGFPTYDVDTILLYDESTPIKELEETVALLGKETHSISVRQMVPEDIKYRRLLKFKDGEVETIEENA